MKKLILIAAAAFFLPDAGQGQEVFSIKIDPSGMTVGSGTPGSVVKETPIGTAEQEFFYDFRCLKDTTDKTGEAKASEDIMVLQVGRGISKFYSYRKLQTDSLLHATPPEQILADPGKFVARGAQSYILFKNYPSGKFSLTDKIGRDNLRYQEDIPEMEWELMDETKEVQDYTCYRAECGFRGRRYIAWYTLEIPVSEGPWKFGGLPGMILEVADSEGHYSFTLNGIRTDLSREITLPDLQYHGTTREKYLKTLRLFETDPIGYMSANAGVNVTVRRMDGSSDSEAMGPREMKYDYMETDYQ